MLGTALTAMGGTTSKRSLDDEDAKWLEEQIEEYTRDRAIPMVDPEYQEAVNARHARQLAAFTERKRKEALERTDYRRTCARERARIRKLQYEDADKEIRRNAGAQFIVVTSPFIEIFYQDLDDAELMCRPVHDWCVENRFVFAAKPDREQGYRWVPVIYGLDKVSTTDATTMSAHNLKLVLSTDPRTLYDQSRGAWKEGWSRTTFRTTVNRDFFMLPPVYYPEDLPVAKVVKDAVDADVPVATVI